MKKKTLHSSRWLAGSILLLGICVITPMQQATAQVKVTATETDNDKTLNGVVSDDKGEPLPGVSVMLKGTKAGTITDANGQYEIQLPNGVTSGTLIFTSLGFANQEIAFNGFSDLNISMTSQAGGLNEVVVIGYGTAKKKDLTGAITNISSKDFNKGIITTPDQFIQGKAAGVVITPSSGQPGVGGTIRIRGGASLNASNDPLIVIDGVPLDMNATINGAPSPLSMLNPNDIESMTILKDASAAAIYGNRASNGVILITTKKGTDNEFHVNLSSTVSLAKRYNQVKLLNAGQLRDYVNKNGTESQIALLGNANTNWQDEIYQDAFASDNNINISGGIKHLPYRLSIGYLGQNGILKTGSLKKTSLGLNLNPSLLDNHLKLDINIKGVMTKNRFANTGAIDDAMRMDPTKPVMNGSKYGGYYEWEKPKDSLTNIPDAQSPRNPVADLMLKNDISTVKRAISNIQADYRFHFLPSLRLVVNAALDVTKSDGSVTVDPNSGMSYTYGGSYNSYEQYLRNQYLGVYLNYVLDIPDADSRFDITLGHDYQDFYRDAPAVTTESILGIGESTTALASISQNTLESYYGRVNYTYKERYLVTASFRRDGTSRFSPDNRWGTFYSLALAWRINQEAFLKSCKAISDLKLRLGVGSTGQQEIGRNYGYLPNYTLGTSTAGYSFGSEAYQTYRPEAYDPKLQWETTTGYNAGIDYGFWDNRLTGSLEYYYKKTANLLSDITIPAGSNLSDHLITNIGRMKTQGVEFSINATPVETKDVRWTLGFNIAYNHNEITKLGKDGDTSTIVQIGDINGGSGNKVQVYAIGHSPNSFYLFQQVYDAQGNPMEGVYARQSDGGLLMISKPSRAPVTIGFNTQFGYKNWSLGMSMHGSFGNYMYNNINSGLGFSTSVLDPLVYIGNTTKDIYSSDFKNAQYLSDYYLENASFVRMDNIVLGYDFGQIINKKINLQVSAMVQNAFVITKYSGLDPEVFDGIDKKIYPKPRIWSLGVNLGF